MSIDSAHLVFSPNLEGAVQLTKKFDSGIQKLRNSGQLRNILGKYGVEDWK